MGWKGGVLELFLAWEGCYVLTWTLKVPLCQFLPFIFPSSSRFQPRSLPFCIPLYVFFPSRQSPTLSLFLRSRIWLFCFLSAFVYFMFFETPFLPSCRWLRPYNLYLLFLYCCILSPLFRTLGTLRYGKEEFSLPRTHAHFPQAIFLPSTRQNGCCQKYIDKNTEHAAKRSFWINYRAF